MIGNLTCIGRCSSIGPDYSTSILIVQKLMDGAMPGCPRLSFGAVDVRDVADLHLRAMTDPKAKGERFLAVAGDFISMHEIAMILKRRWPLDGSAALVHGRRSVAPIGEHHHDGIGHDEGE